MRNILLAILLTLLFAGTAYASPNQRDLDSSETGLDGDALSGSPVSDPINMGDKWWGSTLDWQVVVTPGTTTSVTASCEESADNSTWVWLMHCSDAAASTCVKQTLVYDVTATANFALLIEKVRTQYMRCTFTGTGTGTIVATATVGSP